MLRTVVYVDVSEGECGGAARGRRGVGTARQVRARRPLILNTHTATHLNMFHYKYLIHTHTQHTPLLRKCRFSNKKSLGFFDLIIKCHIVKYQAV